MRENSMEGERREGGCIDQGENKLIEWSEVGFRRSCTSFREKSNQLVFVVDLLCRVYWLVNREKGQGFLIERKVRIDRIYEKDLAEGVDKA